MRLSFRDFFVLLCGASLLCCASASAQQNGSEKILAQINDRKVTLEDFTDQIASVSPSLQPFVKAQKSRYLAGLVEEEILYQEGIKRHLNDAPGLQKQLEQAQRKLIVQMLLQQEIKSKIQVSATEIQDYYKANSHLYNLRERGRFLQIVVRDASLARDISGRLKAGEDFSALAAKFSVDSSRARGGSLGFIEKGTLGDDFDRYAFVLKPGQMSPPVKIAGAFQIIKMVDSQPAKSKALSDVKEGIRRILSAEKEKKATRDYVLDLRSQCKIQVNEALLKEVK